MGATSSTEAKAVSARARVKGRGGGGPAPASAAEEEQALERAYQMFDQEGGMCALAYEDFLESFGLHDDGFSHRLFILFDLAQHESIGFREFLLGLSRFGGQRGRTAQIEFIFKLFEAEGSGSLQIVHLRSAVQSWWSSAPKRHKMTPVKRQQGAAEVQEVVRSLAAIKASGQPFLPRKDFHALVRRHPMVFADAFRLFHVMVPFAGAAVKVMAQLTEEGHTEGVLTEVDKDELPQLWRQQLQGARAGGGGGGGGVWGTLCCGGTQSGRSGGGGFGLDPQILDMCRQSMYVDPEVTPRLGAGRRGGGEGGGGGGGGGRVVRAAPSSAAMSRHGPGPGPGPGGLRQSSFAKVAPEPMAGGVAAGAGGGPVTLPRKSSLKKDREGAPPGESRASSVGWQGVGTLDEEADEDEAGWDSFPDASTSVRMMGSDGSGRAVTPKGRLASLVNSDSAEHMTFIEQEGGEGPAAPHRPGLSKEDRKGSMHGRHDFIMNATKPAGKGGMAASKSKRSMAETLLGETWSSPASAKGSKVGGGGTFTLTGGDNSRVQKKGVGSYSDMSASDMLNYKSAAYRKPRDSNGVPGGLQIRDPFAKKDRRRSSGGSSGSASPDKRKGAALKAVGFSNFI